MPNHLIKEESPYLQQHAHNPVEWYPWCDEAFELARHEEKPIFLSIGYSSCHWCHVMEREVFENEELASALNAGFISIKVDREERPDIDKYFQEIHQKLNKRGGGWPTSIFLTHLGKPFFAATYIPPKPRHGIIGFGELLELISKKYAENRDEILEASDNIARKAIYLQKEGELVRTDTLLQKIEADSQKLFDKIDGGFSGAPKFPHTSALDLLLDGYSLDSNKNMLELVEITLQNMAKGGFYDIIDGGFCRYSVDEEWLVPHFEKMLYDNALLIALYARAYSITKNELYLKVAKKCADFWLEKMCEDGLFFAASDADSNGVEGQYFVYSYDEAMGLFLDGGMSEAEAKEACRALGINKIGNFEHKNIPRNSDFIESELLVKAIEMLKNMRKLRTYPFIDKKIILSWNGMMICALFVLGRVEQSYGEVAKNSLKKVLGQMKKGTMLYHSVLFGNTPKVEGFLEDYAYMAKALLEAYRSTLDEKFLVIVRELCDAAVSKFYRDGVWFFSFGEFNTVDEIQDTSYPSSLAILLQVLVEAGHLLDKKYFEILESSLRRLQKELGAYPLYVAALSKASLMYENMRAIHAKKELLAELTPQVDLLKFPFITFLAERGDSITICNKDSCEASYKNIQELLFELK